MPDEREIRFLGDVQRLALAPGDIIVVKTDMVLNREQIRMLSDGVSERLGTEHKVVVLSHGLEIGILSPVDSGFAEA